MSLPSPQLRERVPRVVEIAVERARLTVVPRQRVRAARMPFVTLVSLLLVGGVVGLLCFNTQMQQASFAATSLQEQAANLTAREQTLHDELQDLRNPQNLGTMAQRAGMVVPSSACILRLSDDRAATRCAPAGIANTPTLLPRPPVKPAIIDPEPNVVVVPARDPDRRHDRKPEQRRDPGRR